MTSRWFTTPAKRRRGSSCAARYRLGLTHQLTTCWRAATSSRNHVGAREKHPRMTAASKAERSRIAGSLRLSRLSCRVCHRPMAGDRYSYGMRGLGVLVVVTACSGSPSTPADAAIDTVDALVLPRTTRASVGIRIQDASSLQVEGQASTWAALHCPATHA